MIKEKKIGICRENFFFFSDPSVVVSDQYLCQTYLADFVQPNPDFTFFVVPPSTNTLNSPPTPRSN